MRTNSINANNDFAKDLRGINRKVTLDVSAFASLEYFIF